MSHLKKATKCVGKLDLAWNLALNLEQSGTGDNDGYAASTRNCHVQAVQAVQKFHAPWGVLRGRSCHRVEDDWRFLSLELVHSSHSRTCGEPFCQRRDLCVVRSHNQDIFIEESKWVSFTTTQQDPTFFRLVRDLTGNVPGEGGLITFADSSWLTSIVLPHQPHFIGQPEDVNVFWGYGLFVDKPGDFVKKPMSACTGREIMTEILGHLRIESEASQILKTSICIPCMMPFITSQFLRRERGDRPEGVPQGSTNLAFIGQFCELPDDVVFTVEYSIRSSQTAVYTLFRLNREPPAVYKGQHDPRVLYKAFTTLHDMKA